jgi:DtxR family Mn-dependent transcriptional regulator
VHCPHGEPIPDKEGNISYPNDAQLVELEIKHDYRLTRVRTHNLDKLRYLDKLGMKPGIEFGFVTIAPFRGPLRLRFGNNDQIIGYELASSFWVEKLN